MARTHKRKRLYMEVLEIRRVLTTVPTAIGIGSAFELLGPQPVAELTDGSTSTLTGLFIDTTTAAPLAPGLPPWTSIGNTSTLSFDVAGTQLIVPDTPLVNLGNSPTNNTVTDAGNNSTMLAVANGNELGLLNSVNGSAVTGNATGDLHFDGNGFSVLANEIVSGHVGGKTDSTRASNAAFGHATIANATITVGPRQTLDIQPTLLLTGDDSSLGLSPAAALRPTVADVVANQSARITPFSTGEADDLWSLAFGQETSTGLGGQAAIVLGGWSPAPAAPRSGQPGGSLFDVIPSHITLDVTELPLPGPAGPATGSDGIGEPPNPTAVDDNNPGLGALDQGDLPQAAAFVTVDIGSNHPDTENDGWTGLDVVVTTSLQAGRDAPGNRQLMVGEIDMARQHRLQLAAAGSLPAPINAAARDDYSRVTPESQLRPQLTTTDLMFVVGREMANDHWFDHWITEVHLPAEEANSPNRQVSDEESARDDAGLPATERSKLLIDTHSKSEQPARSRWQWAVDALLASAGLGAMIFHDRFGQLAEEKREFRLRR